MKKFKNLGRILSKEEQRNIKGGDGGNPVKCSDGCVPLQTNCPSTCPCSQAVGQGNIWKCQTV